METQLKKLLDQEGLVQLEVFQQYLLVLPVSVSKGLIMVR